MPLKKSVKKLLKNSHPVEEGAIIQTVTKEPMSLFEKALMPVVTLNANQFNWPESLLVVGAKRVPVYEKNAQTGWDLKDGDGHKKSTGDYVVRLSVVNGDTAQMLVNAGQLIEGLSELQCTINKDVPLQKFVLGSTLIKLVKPNVMLGFGGQNVDRIVLIADDYEEV